MPQRRPPTLAPEHVPLEPSPLLTAQQTAELLGVSANTLSDWRYRKIGVPFIKLGSRVMYAPEDIAAFIESHKTVVNPLEEVA